jgi:hypothetical protein
VVLVCWCWCAAAAAALAVVLQQVGVPAVERFAERLGGTLAGLDCVSLYFKVWAQHAVSFKGRVPPQSWQTAQVPYVLVCTWAAVLGSD